MSELTSQQRAPELERTRLELQNSRRQCELVKSLLADATTEKEIMYEVGRGQSKSSSDRLQLPLGVQRGAGWDVQ